MESFFDILWLQAGTLSLLIQVGLCVHIYKTGRPYWWIWVIWIGSLIGCLLYVLIEILPEMRRNHSHRIKSSWFVPQAVVIRRARERVEEMDTVENRLALAEILHDNGKKEQAEAVVANCVSGVFKDDQEVIAAVAWYQLEAGKYDEAGSLLEKAESSNKLMKNRMNLLKARVLFGKKHYAEALSGFSALQLAGLGEEPRYYAACCQFELGRLDEARRLLTDLRSYFRKGNKLWRRAERPWYKAAGRQLKLIRAKTTELKPS